jgi:hypothetical protein
LFPNSSFANSDRVKAFNVKRTYSSLLNPVSASPWRWRTLARGQLTSFDFGRSDQIETTLHTIQNRPSFCAFYWVTTFSLAKRVSGWPRERNFGGVTGELRRLDFTDSGFRFGIHASRQRPRFMIYIIQGKEIVTHNPEVYVPLVPSEHTSWPSATHPTPAWDKGVRCRCPGYGFEVKSAWCSFKFQM